MKRRPILAESLTPEGTRVVLFEDTWYSHVLHPDGHREMEPHLGAVLGAVALPDERAPDRPPRRERFIKQNAGPSQWLIVVVEYGEAPARIVTAFGCKRRRSTEGWSP